MKRTKAAKQATMWARRYLSMTGMVFLVLIGAALLKGRALGDELAEAFVWALLSAAVFTGWRYRQARRGATCALCRDDAED